MRQKSRPGLRTPPPTDQRTMRNGWGVWLASGATGGRPGQAAAHPVVDHGSGQGSGYAEAQGSARTATQTRTRRPRSISHMRDKRFLVPARSLR